MALGDVTTVAPDLIAVEVLASATATNSPPASATAGLPMTTLIDAFSGRLPANLSFVACSTAGSATMTATFRAWLMFGTLASLSNGLWAPAGAGTDALKGVLNAGVACGETSSDAIRHCEPIELTGHASRLYVEVTAIGGTNTAVTCFVVGRKNYAVGG